MLPPPMRKALKILGRIIGSIIALLLLIVIGSFLANGFDEQLTPEAKALLSPPPNPYGTQDNIFTAFAGFDAPPQSSILTVGAARIDYYNEHLPTMLTGAGELTKKDPNDIAFKGELECCHPVTSSIWHEAKTQRALIEAVTTDNQELYQRYLAVHPLQGYYDTARPSFYVPAYFVPQPVRSLFLANAALRIQSQSRSQQFAALDDLGLDIQMWKKVLQGDGYLLSKMVAVGALHADFILQADMLADPEFDLTLIDAGHQWMVTPFVMGDWTIGKAFYSEMRMQQFIFTDTMSMGATEKWLGQSMSWWERTVFRFQAQYFKLHATENLQARQMIVLAQFADADPSDFSRRREAYRQWVKRNAAVPSFGMIYNPMGKILVEISAPAYEDYPARVYDVAAMQRLVCLVYQIRNQKIDLAGIPGFLKQHPEWSTPIDAKPIQWDATAGELKVPLTGTHPLAHRFSVKLYPTAN